MDRWAGQDEIYMIGIKGVGMTMLAQFLAREGKSVSGSDIVDEFLTSQVLRREKIPVFSPFSPSNIPASPKLIIHSSAFSKANNPELSFIAHHPERFSGAKIMTYAEALGQLFNQYEGIAVCGSHGKTTVSAWLGYVLWKSKKNPNVLVGSRVPQFKGSSLKGKSRCFVAEVDEYQNKLKYFRPQGVVLNNIDYDHPDFFRTEASYEQAFAAFLKKVPRQGFVVINSGDKRCWKVAKHCPGQVISYDVARAGVRSGADYLASDIRLTPSRQSFALSYKGRPVGRFLVKLWGEHNVLNALAVIAASRQLKVSWADIRRHLAGFSGTERRAQLLGTYHGALIIDDYAHHPTEIQATLSGLRARYKKRRIVTVFHPHTFTRTKALFNDFARSFEGTDELIILDIYGSAREKHGGVSSAQLAAATREHNRSVSRCQAVRNIKSIPLVADYLKKNAKAGDIIVLMGAGDVFRISQYLLK